MFRVFISLWFYYFMTHTVKPQCFVHDLLIILQNCSLIQPHYKFFNIIFKYARKLDIKFHRFSVIASIFHCYILWNYIKHMNNVMYKRYSTYYLGWNALKSVHVLYTKYTSVYVRLTVCWKSFLCSNMAWVQKKTKKKPQKSERSKIYVSPKNTHAPSL